LGTESQTALSRGARACSHGLSRLSPPLARLQARPPRQARWPVHPPRTHEARPLPEPHAPVAAVHASYDEDTRAGAGQRARWTLCLSSYAPKIFTMLACPSRWCMICTSRRTSSTSSAVLRAAHHIHSPPSPLRSCPACRTARGPHAPCPLATTRGARHQTQDRSIPRDAESPVPAAAVHFCIHRLQPCNRAGMHRPYERPHESPPIYRGSNMRALLSIAARQHAAATLHMVQTLAQLDAVTREAERQAPPQAGRLRRAGASPLRTARAAGSAARRARTAAYACRWTCTRTPGRSPCAPRGAWCQTARARARGPACTRCTHPARAYTSNMGGTVDHPYRPRPSTRPSACTLCASCAHVSPTAENCGPAGPPAPAHAALHAHNARVLHARTPHV